MKDQPGRMEAPPASMLGDVLTHHFVNAIVAFTFASTGPVAILLAVGAKTGLSNAELSSWMFGAFFINGVTSLVASVIFRQPLVFLWTIPGSVLIGTAIDNLTYPEIVGAYFMAGGALVLIGLSGLLSRIMDAIPMPIVMGMVAGVLLQFGLGWIGALTGSPAIAVPMTLAYLVVAATPALARYFPPTIAALVIGAVVLFEPPTGGIGGLSFALPTLATPIFFEPVFRWEAAAALVVPLLITVIFAQNSQGIVLLRQAGHKPPVGTVTVICGLASIANAFVGTVSTCLTGPVNGILASSGRREYQFMGGVLLGVFAICFGLAAPAVTALVTAAPPGFIATLGGLALLNVLQGGFTASFAGKFPKSALIAFMVAFSGVEIVDIGAPFWGIVAGLMSAWTIERGDW
jgi:benzoate membrane transport protein